MLWGLNSKVGLVGGGVGDKDKGDLEPGVLLLSTASGGRFSTFGEGCFRGAAHL